jgi:hypothetical protein
LLFVYSFGGVANRVADSIKRVADFAFGFAPSFLGFALCILNLAFGFQISVAGSFSDFIFNRSLGLFPFPFDFIFVR